MKTALISAAILLAAVFPAAALDEQRGPGPEGEAGEGKDGAQMEAFLAERVMKASLVLAGRPVALAQVMENGVFSGCYRISFRVSGVIKGSLGAVSTVHAVVSSEGSTELESLFSDVIKPEACPRIFFLDEGERFRCPPLFRFLPPSVPESEAQTLKDIVAAETGRLILALSGDDPGIREASSRSLVSIGGPAVDLLKDAQGRTPPETSEIIRKTLLAIRDLQVDPCRIIQKNPKYPSTPVPVFAAPGSREIAFRLPPGAVVFRYEKWQSIGNAFYRVKDADGREGWIESVFCESCGEQE